jgi:hypothetical protein
MANENAAIWQVQSGAANGTEATAGAANTVLFNADPVTTGDSSIFNTEIDFRRAIPENEAVDADNNEIQDMGIEGLDIQVTGLVSNVNNDVSTAAVNKLIKFLKDGNTTTGYTKGRYGLRMDDMPQFGVVPTSTYGYHIRSIRFIRNAEFEDKTDVIISLALGGDIASAI